MKALPNILSIFRICLVPVFIACYALDDNDIKVYAIIVFVIANLSDFLDGFIARKFNAQSKLGMFLDPLGDKLITFSALICLAVSNPILIWAVCVFFIKESLMGIGGLVIRKKAKVELPPANWLGKMGTIIFFIVCAMLMIFGNILHSKVIIVSITAALCLTLAAFIKYLQSYVNIMRNRVLQDTD